MPLWCDTCTPCIWSALLLVSQFGWCGLGGGLACARACVAPAERIALPGAAWLRAGFIGRAEVSVVLGGKRWGWSRALLPTTPFAG
jgi:hypothetical protein